MLECHRALPHLQVSEDRIPGQASLSQIRLAALSASHPSAIIGEHDCGSSLDAMVPVWLVPNVKIEVELTREWLWLSAITALHQTFCYVRAGFAGQHVMFFGACRADNSSGSSLSGWTFQSPVERNASRQDKLGCLQ